MMFANTHNGSATNRFYTKVWGVAGVLCVLRFCLPFQDVPSLVFLYMMFLVFGMLLAYAKVREFAEAAAWCDRMEKLDAEYIEITKGTATSKPSK